MLSVILIAKNEEKNIRRCLESITWVDEIVVVDSGSTDNTATIAKEFTDKVFIENDWQGYGIQKQRALAHATGDWVLNLDADETVDESLQQAIKEAMKAQPFDAFRIPIRMCFYGKLMRYSSSPTRHIRLFKRQGASYSKDVVHEKVELPSDARIGQMKEFIVHHCYQDISHLLSKINRYSSYSAQIRINEKKPASLLKTILGSGWMFFRCYIIQRGILDGKEGFLLAFFNAQGTFYRGIKQLYPDQSQLTK